MLAIQVGLWARVVQYQPKHLLLKKIFLKKIQVISKCLFKTILIIKFVCVPRWTKSLIINRVVTIIS